MDPWFSNPNMFGALFGSIVGGVGGSLVGLLGATAGYLVPRGKGRRWILGAFYTVMALGVLMLGVGIFAVATGQPYAIWYPFTLCGVIFAVVPGCLIRPIRAQYDAAEQRRLDAESLRNG